MNGLHHENGTPARVDQTIVSSGAGFGNDPHRLQDAALLAAANAIIFTDRRGVILWANPAFTTLTGYALDEVVGANPRVLKSGKHDPGLYRDLWSTILSGRAWHGEITNRRKDGTLYVEEMTITPVRGDDGEIANFIAIKQDVTRRKEAEEASERANADLLDADRRKDEFLAMLSHELRTPLAAILSAAGLLQQRKVEPETHHTADVIARQAGHMARLLDDLLDVSRVTGGKVALRKQSVAMDAAVRQAVEATRGLVEARGHTLSVSLPREPLWLDADPDRLQQIISNLLTNASKYTEPGGRLWLEVRSMGEWEYGSMGDEEGEGPASPTPVASDATPRHAEIRVRDTGVGIAPELLPHVFDLFVQAERTPDRAQGGLGIGLTMVRTLVELHGGTVEAHSEGPGKGSEFVVRLPAAGSERWEVRSAEPDTSHSALPTSHFPKRILLVEDNTDLAELLALTLEADGHQVVVAHDGPAALSLAAEHRPDLVLMDIGLPGMDGYAVARHFREQAHLHDATLVALTGYGQESDRRRAQEAGFHHHLTKPVDASRLRQVLSAAPDSAPPLPAAE